MSSAVRAGLLACVAPQRARAACRAGGQLLTTPSGSPFTGMIWRPSGLGVLGSGWGTGNQRTTECLDKDKKEWTQQLVRVNVIVCTRYAFLYLLQFPQSHPRRIHWVEVFWAVSVCSTAAVFSWRLCCWRALLRKRQKRRVHKHLKITQATKKLTTHPPTHASLFYNTDLYDTHPDTEAET